MRSGGRKLLTRWLGIAMFMQMLAAGLCLMPTHASAQVLLPDYCMAVDQRSDGHGMVHHACAHCDQPDQVTGVQGIVLDLPGVLARAPQPAAMVVSMRLDRWLLAPAHGPPGSAGLLYRLTQRIRI